jgi:F-type H+-transporting ATPase subunit b
VTLVPAVSSLTVAAAVAHAFAEGEHAAGPLGIPMWIWQLANLVGFFALLIYFVARPLAEMFRKRQLEVEERAKEARDRREQAARLETEIHERLGRLDQDLAEVKARGAAEGEAARAELIARADSESERVRRDAEAEIGRRLALAKEELRRTAADLTASAARELVAAQITPEDRSRLLDESVRRVDALENRS